jgi:hypothetical protein
LKWTRGRGRECNKTRRIIGIKTSKERKLNGRKEKGVNHIKEKYARQGFSDAPIMSFFSGWFSWRSAVSSGASGFPICRKPVTQLCGVLAQANLRAVYNVALCQLFLSSPATILASKFTDTNRLMKKLMKVKVYLFMAPDKNRAIILSLFRLTVMYKVWGFHGGDYEEWCLLGCYAVWLL